MTTNKYATLRGTIARAKRNDCQKVVMRVTLVEELLLQLSNAEKQVAALAAEVQAVRWAAGQVYSAGYNHGQRTQKSLERHRLCRSTSESLR